MASKRESEFYVGYQPKAPRGLARFRAVVAVLLIAGVPAVMGALAIAQRPMPSGTFEFGKTRTFEGVLYETPLPMLYLDSGIESPLGKFGVEFVLVGAGKRGLPEFAAGRHGSYVRFNGSLIENDGQLMIEMNDASSFEDLGGPTDSQRRGRVNKVGAIELFGELVDTKCYSGVMRPATGKVHRACAVRCLEGGVPPGLLVRDTQGGSAVFMLAGEGGNLLDVNPQWAGRLIRAQGQLEMYDEVPVIRVSGISLAETARR